MPRLSSCVLVFLVFALPVRAGKKPAYVPVSIWSTTLNGYQRQKAKGGGFKPETYALALGGRVDGTGDTNLGRDQIGRLAIAVLADHDFHLAENPVAADLLVMVAWGETIPLQGMGTSVAAAQAAKDMADAAAADLKMSSDPVEQSGYEHGAVGEARARQAASLQMLLMQQDMADRSLEGTARLLGYEHDLRYAQDITDKSPYNFHQRNQRDALAAEVTDPRYYIIVTAYDFDAAANHGRKVPRWVTRISIRARENDFTQRADEMLARAGRYLGKDTHRLLRRSRGKVEIGDLIVMPGEATLSDPREAPQP